jgi:hypothetical protein
MFFGSLILVVIAVAVLIGGIALVVALNSK